MAGWWEDYKKRKGLSSGDSGSQSGKTYSERMTTDEHRQAAKSSTWWEDYKKKNDLERKAASDRQRAVQTASRLKYRSERNQRFGSANRQLEENRSRDAAEDEIRELFRNPFSSDAEWQAGVLQRNAERYKRDLPLYQQAMQNSSTWGEYFSAHRQAGESQSAVKNQFERYQQAAQKAEQERNESNLVNRPALYASEHMTPEQISAELDRLRSGAATPTVTDKDRNDPVYAYMYPDAVLRKDPHGARFDEQSVADAGQEAVDAAYRPILSQQEKEAVTAADRKIIEDKANRNYERVQILKAAQSMQTERTSRETGNQLMEEIATGGAAAKQVETGRAAFEAKQQQIASETSFEIGDDLDSNRGAYNKMQKERRERGYILGYDWDNVPEARKQAVYALYAQDPEKAMELAKYYIADARQAEDEERQAWYAQSGWTAALGLVSSAAAHLGAAVDPFGDVGQELTRRGDNALAGGSQWADAATDYKKIPEWVPIVGGKGAGDLYQIAGSVVQSAAVAAPAILVGRYDKAAAEVVGKLGLVLMGSSAAASDYRESVAAGMDEDRAKLHALAAGVEEALFEEVSLDKLIKMDTSGGLKSALKNWLVQSGIEGSEELATSIANRITDELISGAGQSKVERRASELIANGMSATQAKQQAESEWMTDTLYEGFSGFLSGGMMTGGNYALQGAANLTERAVSAAETRKAQKQAGAAVSRSEGSVEALQAYAKDNGIEIREVETADQNAEQGEQSAAQNSYSNRDYRSISDTNSKVVQSIRSEVRGKTAQEQQAVRDSLVEKYGDGIAPAVYNAISLETASRVRQEYGDVDSIQTARSQAVKEIKDESLRRAVSDGYDSAAYSLAASQGGEGGMNTMSRYIQQRNNTGTGEMSMNATVTAQDGSTKTISITGMSEDGKRVSLADGSEVAVKDLQADADTTSAIQQLADLDLGADATKVLQAYQQSGVAGTEGYRWLMDYATAYNQGRTRQISLEQAAQRSSLDERTVMDAYTLGQQAANRETLDGLEKLKSLPKRKGASGRTASIDTTEIKGKTMSKSELEQFELANQYVQALGVDMTWFSSKEKDGKFIGKNGAYENGKIYMDIHAGRNFAADLTSGILATMGHELTHFQQQYAPEEYQALKEFLFEQIVKSSPNGEARLERLIWEKQKRSGNTLSRKAAEDEVVADACQKMLRDSKAVHDFASQQPEAANGVVRWLDKWFKKVRSIFGRGGNYSEEAQIMDSLEQDVKAAFGELWDKALKQAVQVHDEIGNFSYGEEQHADRDENASDGEIHEFTNSSGTTVGIQDGNGHAVYSERTYEEGGREALADYLAKQVADKAITDVEAKQILDSVEEIYRISTETTDKHYRDWARAEVKRNIFGKPIFSWAKSNTEYGKSMDASLICIKRRTLDAVFDYMIQSGKFDNFDMGQQSIAAINDIIRSHGFEIACGLCYIDAKRYRAAMVAGQFVTLYNDLVRSMIPEGMSVEQVDHFNFGGNSLYAKVENGIDTLGTDQLNMETIESVLNDPKYKPKSKRSAGSVEYRTAKALKENPSMRKFVSVGDFMSGKGFENLGRYNLDLRALYNAKKGTGGPKATESDTQYLHEILASTTFDAEKYFNVGGLRVQSFSDYIPRLVMDYAEMIADMAAKQLPSHAYTKEAMFALQFGLSHMKINMSLIPAMVEGGAAPGLDANGNYVWRDGQSFGSTVYGITDAQKKYFSDLLGEKIGERLTAEQGFRLAKLIQRTDGYSQNCGTIAIGVSDKQIAKMLDDPDIRMVIPYHKSGLNHILASLMNVKGFTDYTASQNTLRWNGETWVKLSKGDFNINQYMHKHGCDAKTAADAYLAWCEKKGYKPKFGGYSAKSTEYSESADFTKSECYYKVLIDFTAYDSTGAAAAQQSVQSLYPGEGNAFGSMKSLIAMAIDGEAALQARQDNSIEGIVADIERTLPSLETAQRNAQSDEEKISAYEKWREENGFGENAQFSDREYLDAVDRGDMETAQRMVDEAAKDAGARTFKNGKVRHYYHGTTKAFTSFAYEKARRGNQGFGFYFAAMPHFAERYGNTIDAYILTDNLATSDDRNVTPDQVMQIVDKYGLDIDVGMGISGDVKAWIDDYKAGRYDEEHNVRGDVGILKDLQQFINEQTSAKAEDILKDFQSVFGYDGLQVGWETVLWDNGMMKKADPVTYDDNGNVIPLSERFNEANEDIRYSEREDQSLRGRVSELEDQLDMAELNGLSQAEIRKLNNELIKARGQLDTYAANQRRQAKRTSFNEILRNLENYERVDLESLAEQISDSAWDDYDELSDEELIDALRETINERLEDFGPGEADNPKYGLYVKKPKTAGNISVVRYSDRDYSTPSDEELLMNAKVEDAANVEQGRLLKDYQALGKRIATLEKQLAEAKRQTQLTNRALNTRGIGNVVKTVMKDYDITDARHNGTAKNATLALTDGYQKALDLLDQGASPADVNDAVYNGAVKAAEIILEQGTYSQNLGGKWQTYSASRYLGENSQELIDSFVSEAYADFVSNRYREARPETAADRLVARTKKEAQERVDKYKGRSDALAEANRRLEEKTTQAESEAKEARKAAGELFLEIKDIRQELLDNKTMSEQERKAANKKLKALNKSLEARREEAASWQKRAKRNASLLKSALESKNRDISALNNRLSKEQAAALEKQKNLEAKLEKQIQHERDILAGKANSPELNKLLKAEREKAETRVKEQKEQVFQNYKERKKAGDLRGRIKNISDEMKRRMTNPTDRAYVPASLYQSMTKLADVLDNVLSPNPGTKAEARYRAMMDAIRGMAREYEDVKNLDPVFASEYEQEISDAIGEIERILERKNASWIDNLTGDTQKSFAELNSDELQQLYDLMRQINYTITNATKVFGNSNYKSIFDAQRAVAEQQNSMKSLNAVSRLERKKRLRLLNSLSVMRATEMMAGWDRSAALYQLMHGIEQGADDAWAWVMDYNKSMQDLKTGKNEKEYRQALTKQLDFGITDRDGLKVTMTKMQALQILMTAEREEHNDKLLHLQAGGAVIRNAIDLQNGKGAKARSQTISVTPELIQKINDSLTDWDRAYMKTVRDYFKREGKRTNEILYKLKHKVLKTEEFYVPYTVDRNYLEANLNEQQALNMWVKTPGSTNALKQKAKQPVIIDGMDTVMGQHVKEIGNYIGMAIPIRDFSKVYNGMIPTEGPNPLPVKETIERTFGKAGQHLLTQAVIDVQGGTARQNWESNIAQFLNKLQGAFVRSALLINPSVTIKQAASYIAAESVISHLALERGNHSVWAKTDESKSFMPGGLIAQLFARPEGKTAQRIYNEIDQHTSLHYQRRQGMSMAEIAEQANRTGPIKRRINAIGASMEQSKIGHVARRTGENLNPLTWIQRMDVATTAALWVACKEQAKLDKLAVGSEEFWKRTTELYERCIRETQPMYDGLHRTANQKQAGGLMQYLFPFRTVPIQNHGQLAASYEAYKAARESKNEAKIKEAGKFFRKTVWAQTESAFVFSVMTFLAAILKRKTKKYRDEEGELYAGSFTKGLLTDVGSTLISVLNPMYGSELFNLGSRAVDKFEGNSGYTYDAFSVGVVDMINDLASSGDRLLADAGKIVRGENVNAADFWNHAMNLLVKGGKLAGIPADTVKTYFEGTKGNIQDAIEGRIPALNDESWERDAATNARRYMKAIQAGDTEKAEAVMEEMRENYKEEKPGLSEKAITRKVRNALTSYIKEQYTSKEISEEDAISYLVDYAGKKENDAFWQIREWEAKKAHKGEAEYTFSPYEHLRELIDNGKDLTSEITYLQEHGKTASAINSDVKKYIKKQFDDGELSEQEAMEMLQKYHKVKDDRTGKYRNDTEDEAWFILDEWKAGIESEDDEEFSYEKYRKLYSAMDNDDDASTAWEEMSEHGVSDDTLKKAVSAHLQKQFQAGDISEDVAIDRLQNYRGMDEDEAYWQVDKWKSSDAAYKAGEDFNESNYRDLYAAIDGNKDPATAMKELTSHGYKESDVYTQAKKYLSEKLEKGEITEQAFKNKLSRYCKIVKADEVDDAVQSVKNSVRYKKLMESKPNLDATESQVNAWYDGTANTRNNGHESAKTAGMSIENYIKAKTILADVKDANGNRTGEDEYIAALTKITWLTPRQKDALYYERYKGTTKYSHKTW